MSTDSDDLEFIDDLNIDAAPAAEVTAGASTTQPDDSATPPAAPAVTEPPGGSVTKPANSASAASEPRGDASPVEGCSETVMALKRPDESITRSPPGQDVFDEDTTSTVISARGFPDNELTTPGLSNDGQSEPPLDGQADSASRVSSSCSSEVTEQRAGSVASDTLDAPAPPASHTPSQQSRESRTRQSSRRVRTGPAQSSSEALSEALSSIQKHFIEGFTIEESAQPFPVHRSSLLTDLKLDPKKKVSRRRTMHGTGTQSHASKTPPGASHHSPKSVTPQPTSSKAAPRTPSSASVLVPGNQPLLTPPSPVPLPSSGKLMCIQCGKPCAKVAYYRNETFCSKACAHKKRKQLFSQPGAPQPKRGRPFGSMTRSKPTLRNNNIIIGMQIYKSRSNTSQSGDKSPALSQSIKLEPDAYLSSDSSMMAARFPAENGYESDDSLLCGSEALSDSFKRGDVIHWTVSDVRDFVQALDGCERYAAIFEEEEIDGRALLLLNEDHLLHALDVKLGPALKIISHINMFR